MSIEGLQETLFEDPIGLRLRAARERLGLSMEAAAGKLRLPHAVLEAIEREEWDKLGAPLYIRSYLNSYCKLLDIPNDWVEGVASRKTSPSLMAMKPVARTATPAVGLDTLLRVLKWALILAAVAAAVLFLPKWLASRNTPSTVLLEPSVTAPAEQTLTVPPPQTAIDEGTGAVADGGADPAAVPGAAPAIDATNTSSTSAAAEATGWSLSFSQNTWVDLRGPNGLVIEQGTVPAGQVRIIPDGQLVRATIGNTEGVEVRHRGQVLDLSGLQRENVARFAVSSTGEISAER